MQLEADSKKRYKRLYSTSSQIMDPGDQCSARPTVSGILHPMKYPKRFFLKDLKDSLFFDSWMGGEKLGGDMGGGQWQKQGDL